jgi:predicted ATPase/DNA-binding SARP family transcriptional activator
VEFRILGRLEVVDGGRDRTPRRPKQRALLALLLLRAGATVSADEVADALWDGAPPPAARNAIQGHIATLRKLLGHERIATHDGAYRLALAEDELDAHRFERLLGEARGLEAQERVAVLRDALALFRGEPLEDFRYDGFAAAEAARITELRLLALEERIDAELALGRHERLVPELETLVREAPLRERLWGQLCLALYRSGRQADALAAHGRAREALDELGLQPGVELQRLQRRILQQDATLDLRGGAPVRLPSPPTPFLGRDDELEQTAERLRGGHRVLTLVGAGGCGKTRLAIETARRSAPAFSGGVVFVPLAPLGSPGLVVPALAHALGVHDGGGSAVDAIAARVTEPTLVVLDNVEHLLDAVPALGAVVAAAPAVTLLATSREPLRLYGEQLLRVGPLDDATAVALFSARAEAVGARRPAEAVVREICERLDRLPLAIELAAARADALDAEALLAALAEPLRMLTTGAADHHPRQQTLRRTIEWSHERLGPAERRLFARLGVFAGGWSLDDAEAVCGDGASVVPMLSSLLDKSLVQPDPDAGEPRQAMLETIRAFALEQLAETGEAEALRRRHADRFLALAQEAAPELRGSPGAWLERLDRELANLRAALDTAAALDDVLEAQLAAALWRYWYLRGHLSEGRSRLEHALRHDLPDDLRAHALIGVAVMATNQGDAERARTAAEEARAGAAAAGDRWAGAYAAFMLGHVRGEQGDALYREAAEAFTELGDAHSALLAQRHLALLRAELGDDEGARALHEQNLARARASGNGRIAASTLGALAEHSLSAGRPEDAVPLLRESIDLHRELGDVPDTGTDLCRLAAALAATGDARTATLLVGAFHALGPAVGQRQEAWAARNEQTLEVARSALGPEELAAALEEGGTLPLDDVLERVSVRTG